MANYWDGVISWLKQDPEISGWWSEDMSTQLRTLDNAQLAIWSAFTAYQGFDIKRILKLLKSNYDTYMQNKTKETTSVTIQTSTGDVTFDYDNKKSIIQDIEFIIFLFASRGSVWDKFTRKSYSEMATITDWMQEKYNIDTTVRNPNTAVDADVITVPRIAACFPYKICDYFHLGYGKALCSEADIGYPTGANAPKAIFCSFITAALYPDWIKITPQVHLLIFLIHILNDDVLHRKKQDYTPLDTMFTYYAASYRSAGTPFPSRKKYLSSRDFADAAQKGFNANIISAAGQAEDRIRALRPSDRSLNTVLAQLIALL